MTLTVLILIYAKIIFILTLNFYQKQDDIKRITNGVHWIWVSFYVILTILICDHIY